MLRLALPVALTYLGLMSMAMVDLLFVGRVSAVAVGAVGLGSSVFAWFMTFGLGLLMGLDFISSFAKGAGRLRDGFRAFRQALLLSVGLAIPFTAILCFIAIHLDLLGINPEVRGEAALYLQVVAFSILPVYAFSATRQYLQTQNVATPTLVILILANVLNFVLNYALVLGHWGFPRLGAYGSAWGTLLARLAMMLAGFAYLYVWDRKHHGFFRRKQAIWLHRERVLQLLNIGIPIAMQNLFEVGVFATSTILVGRLTADALAAHQIVLNLASFTFMIPLGVGSATSVLVGQALGRRDQRTATRMGWRGIQLATVFMACSCLAMVTFATPLLRFYTFEPGVIELGRHILLIAAAFQLSDGIQTSTAGALRGLADTRSAMIANLCGHWVIGLPVGVWLCYWRGWGVAGIWTGLSIGLTVVAVSLVWRWVRLTRRLVPAA